MDYQEWRHIVLADRKQRIDAFASEYGEEIVITARKLLNRKDVTGLDAELTRIGVHV